METVILIVVLVVIVCLAARSYAKRLSKGCCNTGDSVAEKKVRVADRDKRHYPYHVEMTIDGMVCGHCVRRVENALNRLEGTWAQVDLGSQHAQIALKAPMDEQKLREAVREAGYTALRITPKA